MPDSETSSLLRAVLFDCWWHYFAYRFANGRSFDGDHFLISPSATGAGLYTLAVVFWTLGQ